MSDPKTDKKKPSHPHVDGCRCADVVNEDLRKKGLQVVTCLSLRTGMSRPAIALEHTTNTRPSEPTPLLFATFCPFCGKRFP